MALFRRHRPSEAGSGPAPAAADESPDSPDTLAGPFDIADAPEVHRADFGGLQIPPREGMEIALEVDQASRRISGLTVTYRDSALQVNAFAAPRSSSLWSEVRGSLREAIAQQGGTTETRDGSFGDELYARIPVQTQGSTKRSYRPLRFVGVDGPRWLLRVVVSGAALQHSDVREEVEEIIRSIVVVRGSAPMAPKEVIELHVPADRGGQQSTPLTPEDIDPLGHGPSIAEIR
ncbi:MAG: DUF3710 domain-containing protein [Dermabacter sp.]|nr:DUF3710 domain-containing protein [Dermabacter sp.]